MPNRGPRAAGFTLIEMLVVVTLLSATALMAFALTAGRDGQTRFEDTHRRLAAIIDAVRGPAGAVWNGEMRLSGFVADNGRLPASVRELSDRDALVDGDELIDPAEPAAATAAGKLQGFRLRTPRFDPQPDAQGWNDGGEIALDATDEKLWKGLRRYLESRLGSAVYRDPWGNVSALAAQDALHYGWQLALPASAADSWRITSLGADNASGGSIDFDGDIARAVTADDWGVDVAGWSIRIVNRSGVALADLLPPGGQLSAALLVYENRAGGSRWRRYTTSGLPDLADGDSATLTFPPGGYPGGAIDTTRVPQGEHLLVLLSDPDAVAHNGNDTPWLSAGARLTRKPALFAHAAPPAVEFVLR